MNVYTIEPLTSQNPDKWDSIVLQCQNSTAFHAAAWRDALDNAFKQLQPVYLLIKKDEMTVGGIPAYVFQPIPGIRLWHSMPWNLFGGPQIIESEQHNSRELISTIETYLQTESPEKGWCELCLTLSPEDTIKYGDFLTEIGYKKTERFTHILNTNGDVDALWQAYNKRVRGAVRKAQNRGWKLLILIMRTTYPLSTRCT